MQRIFRTLAAASIVLFGLGACESGQKIAAGYGFAGADAGRTTGAFATAVDSSKLIYVVPVEGISGPARMVLADAIAASLRDAKQPAVLTQKINEMGPTVTGRIIEAHERGSVVWVTALWELRAPYGTAVTEYRQQVVVDAGLWKTGSAEAINLLVSDAGPRVVAMVHDFVSPLSEQAALASPDITAAPAPVPVLATPAPEKTPPPVKAPAKAPAKDRTKNKAVASLARKGTPEPGKKTATPTILMEIPDKTPPAAKRKTPPRSVKKPKKGKPILMPVPAEGPNPVVADPPPVSWGRPAFLIKAVKGAPGDGNKALTRAMKTALRKSDLTVTEDPRQAKFVIEGRVEISAPVNGRQQAKIIWVVNTMDGDEVGKAVQENAIKAGSLNGTWGRVADIVSSAAITGIQELFGIEKKQSFRRNREAKFSNRTDMPRVPGRALPPP